MALVLIFVTVFAMAASQRPFFAPRPVGYPELVNKTTSITDALGNRFGEDDNSTIPLPIEAGGDRDLVERLSKLPIDKQPFWFINWQALEQNRKKPQSYPQRPNPFIDPAASNSGQSTNPNLVNSNSVNSSSNPASSNSNSANLNSNSVNNNLNSATNNSLNSNVQLGNRNGFNISSPTDKPTYSSSKTLF